MRNNGGKEKSGTRKENDEISCCEFWSLVCVLLSNFQRVSELVMLMSPGICWLTLTSARESAHIWISGWMYHFQFWNEVEIESAFY